ncbi:hypothetical protein ACROYT_G022878 [Oculina patagonica]
MKEVLKEVVTSSFKEICQKSGSFNVCPRGRQGPPGRKGRKGSQGITGPPGRAGKQGIMGPPGIRGEKGIKGDIGPMGIPGIKGEPGESISAPKVTISPSQLTANKSNTAALFCSATGHPAPQVSWSKVNGSLPSNRTKLTSEGLMQIVDVRLEDAGKYKCLARNILGEDEKVASLVVQSRPKVSLSLGPSYVEKGKNITLPTCHVTGFPPAVITWSKVRDNLSQTRSVSKDGQLSIINAQKKDFGLYTCKASNRLPGTPNPQSRGREKMASYLLEDQKVGVDGTLQIWNLKQEDSGMYTCTASSAVVFKTYSAMMLTVRVCGPVGVEDRNTIPDARMTASTIHSSNYYPYYGRLNEVRGSVSWATKTSSDRTDYLQVDMGAVHSVCAVATQGGNVCTGWLTGYEVYLSFDGVTWNAYEENNVKNVSKRNDLINHIQNNECIVNQFM